MRFNTAVLSRLTMKISNKDTRRSINSTTAVVVLVVVLVVLHWYSDAG